MKCITQHWPSCNPTQGFSTLHQMLDLRLANQQQPPITLHNMSPDETVFYSYLYHELSLQKTLSGTQLPVPVFPAFRICMGLAPVARFLFVIYFFSGDSAWCSASYSGNAFLDASHALSLCFFYFFLFFLIFFLASHIAFIH